MWKEKTLFILFFLFSVCKGVFAQEQNLFQLVPAQSEHLQSTVGGFIINFEKQEFYYFLSLDIVKPFDKEVFSEIHFENPNDPSQPFIQEKVIKLEDRKLEVNSPAILGLKKDSDYFITILIYADEQRTQFITEHKQKIKAVVDNRYFEDVGETVKYVLAGDYETAFDIFSWQSTFFKAAFRARTCFTVLDAFKRGVISKEYVAHYFQGQSYQSKKEFKMAIEEFKKAVGFAENYPEGYMSLGAAYLSLGESKKAFPYLKRCIELKPDYASAYWGLASVYGDLGQKDKEKESLQKARNLFELQDDLVAIKGIDTRLRILEEQQE